MRLRDKNIKQILTDFIHQAQKADLKTSTYPKQWDGWTMKVSFGQGSGAGSWSREVCAKALDIVFAARTVFAFELVDECYCPPWR